MKILHITATHLNPAGGIPVVLKELVSAQNALDDLEARVLSVKADVSKMESDYFDFLGKQSFELYVKSFAPDVVIFHSHYYVEYLSLYRCLIKMGVKYYIEPHGSFGKMALQKSKIKKKIANHILFRFFMKKAEGFIFLNESEKQDSQFRKKNDLVIPNGVKESGVIGEIKPGNSWFFYFIGRYDVTHKGLDFLFDALDILEKRKISIVFNFYGTGEKNALDYIKRRIEKYNTIVVRNQGAIYGDEQARTLEQCGIMVLTSRYEGFPMTVLEGWKYGNPCIVTPGTNVCGDVSKDAIGWKTELNATKIADAILRAKEEYENERIAYIDKCKTYVVKKYGWSRIAEISKRCFSL